MTSSRASRSDVCRRALSIASAQRSASSCARARSCSVYRRPDSAVVERDVADHRAAHAQRHDHRRDHPDLAEDPQLLRVLRGELPELVGDLLDEVGLAGADHLRRADRRVGVERVAPVVLEHERPLGGVDVLPQHALDAPVGPQQLDEAPVRVFGHGEPRHRRQRLLEVQRPRERVAGFAEIVRRRLGAHGAQVYGARRALRPRTRGGSPRTGGGAPPRRGGWRSPCPGSPSRARR